MIKKYIHRERQDERGLITTKERKEEEGKKMEKERKKEREKERKRKIEHYELFAFSLECF